MSDAPHGPMRTKKLTPGQVAKKLGVARNQVDRWLRSGRMPCLTLENGDRLIEARHARRPKYIKPGPKAGDQEGGE